MSLHLSRCRNIGRGVVVDNIMLMWASLHFFAVAISDGGCRATIPTATRTAEAPPNAGTPGTGDSDGKHDPYSFRIFFTQWRSALQRITLHYSAKFGMPMSLDRLPGTYVSIQNELHKGKSGTILIPELRQAQKAKTIAPYILLAPECQNRPAGLKKHTSQNTITRLEARLVSAPRNNMTKTAASCLRNLICQGLELLPTLSLERQQLLPLTLVFLGVEMWPCVPCLVVRGLRLAGPISMLIEPCVCVAKFVLNLLKLFFTLFNQFFFHFKKI